MQLWGFSDKKVAKKLQHKYVCKLCDYTTSNKTNYDKHILTRKHIEGTTGDGKVATYFGCPTCHKKYLSRNGYWMHKKKCEISTIEENTGNDEKNIPNMEPRRIAINSRTTTL